ncbi:MAG: hypothetical protein COW24_03600 [Candidatus Kerfeldbacteria bacterium CG15_BIG_FIL_POST_REV_8_21_14_020_45_12]|uniref:NAD-dependent epimerase/dehydratase domain-containing protein n=1 Tax=Candidatus Kerfeldbacteria bacterium CG15_BIG_FIL_POST_REV_8_21_14_020_45_12 TaxID=2014247 RepID=A0A2M7H3D8_9BACT|nr:MAG: hypothetical protein COW24_03600 [Candidatus Kerfeldbacteria bacterium CG15_BIG_FIL_POST_REV_8_21_14_020_45_12]PJA93754.1 MAG: hypothetical protein CO132_01795 [Candidatus Kerfeldbacteria bacterium CG_4_9_14_3_um_filter_45_8]
MKIQSILVIGEESFLGQHLVARLLSEKYNIVTTSREKTSLQGTDHITLDLGNPDLSFFQGRHFDAVIHLAAISNPRMCDEMPDLAQQINVTALRQLVETLQADSQLKTFIYPSSVTLVKDGQEIIDEDSEIDPDKNVYTKTKYEAEKIIQTAIAEHDFPATILRFPNIYGPGQPGGAYATFVPQVIEQALNDEKIEIWNTDTVRDWVYVEDIVDLFVKTLNAVTCGLYQIGSGRGTSTGEIAENLAKLSGVELTCLNKSGTGPKHIITNPAKIQQATGWTANTPINEGLKKTFDYFISHPQS